MGTTTTTTKWVAGWNLPGCIPEMEPAVFESEDEAIAWVREEEQRAQEDFGSDDPYVYWVELLIED